MPVPLPADLSTSAVITLISIGGALGGSAEYLRQIAYKDEKLITNGNELLLRPAIILWLSSAAIGVSGAIAFQLIIYMLNAFDDKSTPGNIVYLLSVSVAAGFGARILLPEITERLRDQVKKLRTETDGLAQQTNEARDLLDNLRTETDELIKETRLAIEESGEARIVSRALNSLLDSGKESERRWCREELTKRVQSNPTNRSYVIPLGRLHRSYKDLKSGLRVLDDFLQSKEQKGERDGDYADVLYNKACYLVLSSEDAKDETEKKGFLKMGLECLSTSIGLRPENKEDARTEEDFDALRPYAHDEFNQMVEK